MSLFAVIMSLHMSTSKHVADNAIYRNLLVLGLPLNKSLSNNLDFLGLKLGHSIIGDGYRKENDFYIECVCKIKSHRMWQIVSSPRKYVSPYLPCI